MSPEATVNMLNTYLSILSDKVLGYAGMVNKFIGDNVMAIWNAPNPEVDHASLAVRAAWEAQQEITALQERDPSLPPVRFGNHLPIGNA